MHGWFSKAVGEKSSLLTVTITKLTLQCADSENRYFIHLLNNLIIIPDWKEKAWMDCTNNVITF